MDKTIIASVILLGWLSGVHVQRSRPSPQIIEPPTDEYSAPAGRPFSLQCVAPMNTALEWYFGSRKIYEGRQSDYLIEERMNYAENQKFSTLTTKEAASNVMSGEYRCQDANNRQSYDAVDVTVTSMAAGGGGYDSGSSYGSDGGYGSDSGYDGGMSSRSRVEIVNPRGDRLSVQERGDMTLECRGPSSSTLTWYVNNRQVYENRGSSYDITERIDYSVNKKISILTNKGPASAAMIGEYRCQDASDRNSYDEVDVQVGRQVNPWGNGANGGYSVATTQSGGGGMASKPLVFSTIIFEPYLMENEDSKAVGNDRFVGFIPDLVKELAKRLDLEYELRLVKDNKWGARDSSSGTWNGMIGEVIRGEADLAAAPLTVTDLRRSVVDFTSIFQEVMLTALVSAGSNLASLDDVLRSNLTYGAIQGGGTAQALMSSRDQKVSQLYSNIVSHNGLVKDTEEGRQKAKDGGYAFIMEKPIADYYVAADCSLETAGEFFEQSGFAFAAPQGYRDLAKFNQALAELKRDGEIQALLDEWWAPQPCSAPKALLASSLLLLASFILSVLL